MTIEVVYKNDYGYAIDILIQDYNWDTEAWEVKDISGFSTLEYIIEKPNGTVVTVEPSFKTDGTDGYLRYTTSSSSIIFNLKGAYQIVARLTSGSQQFTSTIYRVNINNPLGG